MGCRNAVAHDVFMAFCELQVTRRADSNKSVVTCLLVAASFQVACDCEWVSGNIACGCAYWAER